MAKRKIYWWLLQLDKLGGTEMVSTFLANHLCDEYDITIISSAHIENNAYEIDPRIKILSLEFPHDVMTLDQSLGYYFQNGQIGKIFKALFNAAKFFVFKRNKIRKQIENKIISEDALLICSAIDSYWLAPKKGNVYFHFHFNSRIYLTFPNNFALMCSRKPDKTIFLLDEIANKILSKKKNDVKLKQSYCIINNPCRLSRILNLENHHHQICFLGRFVKQKNPLFALSIIKELKNRQFEFHFTMAGHGALKKKMDNYIKKNHLEDVVDIVGTTTDVKSFFLNYDLVLFPSLFEGSGLIISEANSISVPVISSNWGDGVHDMIKNGVNGYIIDEYDEKKYADKIIELLSDDVKLEKLKQSSYEESDKYNIKNIIPDWKKIL